VKTWFQNRRMKQKKLHRKGSDCNVIDPMSSPLSVPGDTSFADDDLENDVINMAAAACVSGHVTIESRAESTAMCLQAVFEQKQRQQQQMSDDDDDDIRVDSSATESDADL